MQVLLNLPAVWKFAEMGMCEILRSQMTRNLGMPADPLHGSGTPFAHFDLVIPRNDIFDRDQKIFGGKRLR